MIAITKILIALKVIMIFIHLCQILIGIMDGTFKKLMKEEFEAYKERAKPTPDLKSLHSLQMEMRLVIKLS